MSSGETFHVRGRIEMANVEGGPIFDEHMFMERKNGERICCLRVKAGIAESASRDGGRTWSKPELSQNIHGPSSRLLIRRLCSGCWLRVFYDSCSERKKMTAFLAEDEGATWPFQLLQDTTDCVVTDPDGIEAANGTLYVTYDADRQNGGYIRMARFTETDIRAGKIILPQSALLIEVDHSRPVPVL